MTSLLNSVRAPAKINLFLHVGEKRTDGFHALQSLAVFAQAGDDLSFTAGDRLSLTVEGPFAASLGIADDNLVLRAARALADHTKSPMGANITLTKNLPVASGIGGGSSDAAAALHGLARLWNLNLPEDAFSELATELGSDVPVCLVAKPAWMEGRGEIVTQVTALPRLPMLLVNPGAAVPTRDVFANLAMRSGTAAPRVERFEDTADLLRFLETAANDLEAPARVLCPVIGVVLDALCALPGALISRMSGSGATCFAIFPDDGACTRAAALLHAKYPGWWIAPTAAEGVGIEKHETRAADIGPTPDGL